MQSHKIVNQMYKLLTNAGKWHNENKSEHQHFNKHYNYYHQEKSLRTNML